MGGVGERDGGGGTFTSAFGGGNRSPYTGSGTDKLLMVSRRPAGFGNTVEMWAVFRRLGGFFDTDDGATGDSVSKEVGVGFLTEAKPA